MAVRAITRVATLAGAMLALAACVGFSPDRGMDVPTELAGGELRAQVKNIQTEEDAADAREQVTKLLKRPLTAESAVQVALLNNRGLQAAYNELGIAEAVRVQQSQPPHPTIEITRLSSSAEIEIDRQIVGSILALATLPARSEIASERFRQAQLVAALETLRVAAEARRAFYRAVAARQAAALLEQANEAAGTTSQLAKRLGETGALNKLDQTREHAFYAELTTDLARARQRADSERERLIRVLGLWGSDLSFTLASKLPPLPKRALALATIEQTAVGKRVDLQIARIEMDTLAKSYGLSKATRFVNVLDAGYADKITNNRETGERTRAKGFTVSLEVPIYDFGEARVREAEQTYLQAVNRLAEKAVKVRSEAREAYRNYRATYDIARHYQADVLPLRKIISEEMILRYGAMQVDVFALLTEARQRIAINAAAVDALRDFWLASTDLSAVVIGGGAGGGEVANTAISMAGPSGGH